MNDVFISYSHEDRVFKNRLRTTFLAAGYQVWSDDDIPFASDWWADICRNIEQAQVVLFVISPSSLSAPMCHLELAHARSFNKRVIPILFRRGDENTALAGLMTRALNVMERTILDNRDMLVIARDNWELINGHQWIRFDTSEPFEALFRRLQTALETDLQHVYIHTRLLLRAQEWHNSGRDVSLLLAGSEIDSAENWLQAAGSANPLPLPLHTEYIQQSRREHQQREAQAQRIDRQLKRLRRASRAFAGFGVLAALAAVLLLVIGIQVGGQAAAAQATLDVVNTSVSVAEGTVTRLALDVGLLGGVSESRRLASAADLAQTDGDVQLALLLSIAALNSSYSAEAEAALTRALGSDAPLFTLAHNDSVNSAYFSPDGRAIVTASDDGTAVVWDALDGKPRYVLDEHSEQVNSAIFSPDGHYIVTAGTDEVAIVWDALTGRWFRYLQGHRARINSAAFSPDTRLIVTASADGTAMLWDVQTGSPLLTLAHAEEVYTAVFSPDGRYVLTASADSTTIVWDAASGQRVRLLAETEFRRWTAVAAVFSPDGSTAITRYRHGVLTLWDVNAGLLDQELGVLGNFVDGLSFAAYNPAGDVLLTTRGITAVLWDLSSGAELRTLVGHTDRVYSAAFSADGRLIVTAGQDGRALVWYADYREMVRYACLFTTRDLTPSERFEHGIALGNPICPQFASESSAGDTAADVTPSATLTPLMTWTPAPFTAATLPVFTPLPTLAPTFTPESAAQAAVVGENIGRIAPGGGQVWLYAGQADELLTVRVLADAPANAASDAERTAQNLFDTRLLLYAPDGTLLDMDDDIRIGELTDSELVGVQLSETGVYRIEVRSFNDASGGGYRLVIESLLPTPNALSAPGG